MGHSEVRGETPELPCADPLTALVIAAVAIE
jgi:hypothetical protein